MPLLDVSDVFGDPLFTDANGAQLVRGTRAVDAYGREQTVWAAQGDLLNPIIQPASGAALRLFPEMTRAEVYIDIYTQTRLLAPTDSSISDRVVWNGRTYTVELVEDFSGWGVGYVYAMGKLLEMTEDGA